MVNVVNAATITTAGSGNWNSVTNNAPWPGGVVPAATDVVIIASTHTVTVSAIATIAGVTINNGGTLTWSAAVALTLNGPFVNNGTFTKGTGTVTFGSASAAINAGTGTPDFNIINTLTTATTLTINTPVTCASLTLNGTSVSNTITISGTNSLGISGLLSIPRPVTSGVSTLAVGAGTLTCGSYTSTATTAGLNSVISISTGSVTISGATTTTGGAGGIQFTFTGAGTLNFGGTTTGGTTAAITTFAGSTVNYSGAAQTLYSPITYDNLTLSGTGAKTFPTGAATINGIHSIENGTNANTFTGTITYGAAATLQYNAGASARTVSTEWPATRIVGSSGT